MIHRILLSTFVFLFIAQTEAYTPKASWLKDLVTFHDLKLITTPEEDHKPIYDAFAKAQKTIRIGIFGISSQEMADQIILQAKRGIKITIICDKYCTSSPKRAEIFEQLKAAGVEMITATTGFTITHWKMFVVDDSLAFISTMNFITRSNQMRDIGVFTSDKSVISEVLLVFNQDLINAKNTTAITPLLIQPNLVWSPINSEKKITDLINSADKSIEIWIENMGNSKVHLALQQAALRKVKVRILTSVCGLGMPADAAHKNLKDLIARGITVKGTPFPANQDIPYIHAKTINVDHETLFLGSENFSPNSLLKARELGIVFNDAQVERKLADLFEKDWNKSVDVPETPPENCSALSTNTPE